MKEAVFAYILQADEAVADEILEVPYGRKEDTWNRGHEDYAPV